MLLAGLLVGFLTFVLRVLRSRRKRLLGQASGAAAQPRVRGVKWGDRGGF